MQKAGFSGLLIVLVSTLTLSDSSQSSEGHWDVVDHSQVSYSLKKEDNVKKHRTRVFRHQPGLHLRHDLDFKVALQPQEERCDEPFTFKLVESETHPVFAWTQKPVAKDKGELLFQLHVNRSIPVGKYALTVNDPCSQKNLGRMIRLGDVHVLFNPQSEGEPDARVRRQATPTVPDRDEYIDNNCGYLWLANGGIAWDYAVGSKAVTDSTSALMGMMTPTERADKVLYSRKLSELIGNYVVCGRWDGRYSGGMDPTQWVGSEGILSRWLRTQRPVRYGQCWVFAAVFTTILRASGISARSVTNYDSHHDRGLTDDGMAVLRQYDNIVQDDEPTWNFHVWTEAWLERPDLGQPAEWNAVDATPQEPSPLAPDQPYRAGPAYVPFIRSDMRNADYDTYFILAEVNAKKICPRTGKPLPTAVGTAVVTKKPGMERRLYNYQNPEVITKNYKIANDSETKRVAEAAELVLPPPYVGCERHGGMRITSTPVSPMVGETFVINVMEGNVSVEDTVIRMELMNYMGESLETIDNFTDTKELNVSEMDYLPYLGNSSIFRFTVGTYNKSGGFEFHDAIRVRLQYNEIDVQVNRAPNLTTITATVTYTNPLSVPMTGVVLSMSSPNSTYMRLEQPDVPANSTFTATLEVQCGDDDGNVMIPVSLDSDETQSAYGFGWTSCGDEPSNAGALLPSLQVMLISLLVLHVFN